MTPPEPGVVVEGKMVQDGGVLTEGNEGHEGLRGLERNVERGKKYAKGIATKERKEHKENGCLCLHQRTLIGGKFLTTDGTDCADGKPVFSYPWHRRKPWLH
jgi:hypothetical protein